MCSVAYKSFSAQTPLSANKAVVASTVKYVWGWLIVVDYSDST